MEKLWLLRISVDWHNCDPTDITEGYRYKKDAISAMKKAYKETKQDLEERRDIVEERKLKESMGFVTSADDYYNSWVEEIVVN